MSATSFLDLNGLAAFKRAQDTYNNANFVRVDPVTGYLDASKLPPTTGDVIVVHIDRTDPDNFVFFEDVNGAPASTALTPEKGKLYIDVDNNDMWRWSGSRWIEMKTSSSSDSSDADVITDAEIQALFATGDGD